MRAGVMAVGAAVVAVLWGGVGPAMAQSVETGLEHYQGRWIWNGAHKAKHDPNNVSRIQFTGPDTAVYCYNKGCRNVRITNGTGGSYAFSMNGKDRFEFSPLDDTRKMARFWGKFGPQSQAPDASATFTYKGGH